ncbi:hypothetical protein ZWY2020_014562 [Hordeum vulgare]|nr:hypothetical protein ZWY2020_014562 [Hordeum vulgare]
MYQESFMDSVLRNKAWHITLCMEIFNWCSMCPMSDQRQVTKSLGIYDALDIRDGLMTSLITFGDEGPEVSKRRIVDFISEYHGDMWAVSELQRALEEYLHVVLGLTVKGVPTQQQQQRRGRGGRP